MLLPLLRNIEEASSLREDAAQHTQHRAGYKVESKKKSYKFAATFFWPSLSKPVEQVELLCGYLKLLLNAMAKRRRPGHARIALYRGGVERQRG